MDGWKKNSLNNVKWEATQNVMYQKEGFYSFRMPVLTLSATQRKCVWLTGQTMLSERYFHIFRAMGSVDTHATALKRNKTWLELVWDSKCSCSFQSLSFCFDISLRLWPRFVSFLSSLLSFSPCSLVSSPLSLSLLKKEVKVRPVTIALVNGLQGQTCV